MVFSGVDFRKAASWEVSLLEASPSHLHGSLGSADSPSESCPERCPDAHPPATGLDQTQQGSTVRVDFRGLRGNSPVTRPLGSAALAPSPAHSTESLLIEMKGPSHHLSVTWKPELPKAQGSALPPLRTHTCAAGNKQSEHSPWLQAMLAPEPLVLSAAAL